MPMKNCGIMLYILENIKCVQKRASVALVSQLCKVLLITILPLNNTAGSNGENKAHVK